jgi:hypothetical protein
MLPTEPDPDTARSGGVAVTSSRAGARVARVALVALLSVAAGGSVACTQSHVVLEPSPDAGPISDGAGGEAGRDASGPMVTVVSIASYHTCAVASGALYCWGANDEGRLGVGDTNPRPSPARVGTDADWATVAVNARATVALKRDGTLWSFGANDAGQLGLGDFSARKTPTRIGDRTDWTAVATRFNHVCALARDGSLWCWGQNGEGQLGQDDGNVASTDRPVPTQVTTDHDFAAVDAGDGHTCALRTDRTLWCWGRNSEAELGQGSSTPLQIHRPIQVGAASDWQAIQSGQSSTCGLRAGGEVLCWGSVFDDAIPGSPAGTVVASPTPIGAPTGSLALSFNTFGGCVLDGQGGATCWGRNAEGQLGLGNMDVYLAPVPLDTAGWSQMSVGRFANCGIRDGGVACAGDNRAGELGRPDFARTAVFVDVPLVP